MELEERPPGYVGPNLDPADLVFTPKQLAPDVYALVASPMPRDNSGVIIGARGALVVDAGINSAVAREIQAHVRRLTTGPLLYLANTTYHGDHTFGNAAFPRSTVIVSSRINRDRMVDLLREKRMRSGNLRGNTAALDDVVSWRKPDLVFERFLEIDLGGLAVQLWHFGPGNGPGDTIVYVPTAKAAWTGNFLGKAGIAPMLLEGGPRPYMVSLARMKETLDLDVIVPGHGPIARGGGSIDAMIAYLGELDHYVRAGVAAGKNLETLLDERHIRPIAPLAALSHLVSPALKSLDELNRNMDRLNVLATWRALENESTSLA